MNNQPTPGEATTIKNRQILRKLTIIPSAVLLLAFPTFIHAAEDVDWVGGNGTGSNPRSLNDAANWSSDPSVPGPDDSVFFTESTNTHLTTTAVLTNASASFSGSTPNYYMRLGAGNTWTLTDSLSVHLVSGAFWRVFSGTIYVTNEDGNATATFGSDTTRGSLRMDGGTLEVDILNITGAANTGNQGLLTNSGQLDVLNGSTITTPQNLKFGTSANNEFTANFLGGDNSFTAPEVWIGENGKGIVTMDGADTTLSVTGASFVMGADGTGSGNNVFTVSGGAEVTTNANVLIGNHANQPENTMTVTGTGSNFETTGSFSLGTVSSDNELIVSAGGSVNLLTAGTRTYVGQGENASGNRLTVTGQNSLYQTETTNADSYISVGHGANASDNQLLVTDGGRVSTYQVYAGLGGANATENSVTVTNGGILEVASALATSGDDSNTITASHSGVLQFTTAAPTITANGGVITLGEGGIVSFTGGITNAPTAALTGLTYSGGNHALRLDNAQNTSVVGNYTFGNSGTYSRLELRNGGVWNSSGTLLIGDSGELTGNGTVNSAVTVQDGGTLAIGQSPGTMIFNDDLTLEIGSISLFEINDFGAGLYDLAQGGAGVGVTFGGTLNLAFATGFNTLGSVQIFDFESYTGDFLAVNTSGLASGYVAEFDAVNGMVIVNVIPEPGTWALLGIGLGVMLLRARVRYRLS